jgi:hypothetical protein
VKRHLAVDAAAAPAAAAAAAVVEVVVVLARQGGPHSCDCCPGRPGVTHSAYMLLVNVQWIIGMEQQSARLCSSTLCPQVLQLESECR